MRAQNWQVDTEYLVGLQSVKAVGAMDNENPETLSSKTTDNVTLSVEIESLGGCGVQKLRAEHSL